MNTKQPTTDRNREMKVEISVVITDTIMLMEFIELWNMMPTASVLTSKPMNPELEKIILPMSLSRSTPAAKWAQNEGQKGPLVVKEDMERGVRSAGDLVNKWAYEDMGSAGGQRSWWMGWRGAVVVKEDPGELGGGCW
ncbi:hypothetical protein NPIL_294041 [Nephila pilipes]|uniref:Uncharacterized protein n=1 Tax=Nephila pilipes TaxID=299642 RepID=A0A8X6PM08_NEPPI|nr:hypothetical protein NPIL_294041 [Nephila pilipes]